MVRGPAIASEGRGVPPALKEGRWSGKASGCFAVSGATVRHIMPNASGSEASKAEAALQSSGRAELHNSWSGVQAGGGSMLFARRVVLASVLVARQAGTSQRHRSYLIYIIWMQYVWIGTNLGCADGI